MNVLGDDFFYQPITIDTANTKVFKTILAKEDDANGRGLLVTLTENGMVRDTTGIALNLKWEHTYTGGQGLDSFTIVDESKGTYKITYPSEMLYRGLVKAFIQIIDNDRVVGTRNLKIIVEQTVGDNNALESSNSFTALNEALIRTNQMKILFDEVIANVTSDSEVISARSSIAKNKTFPVLGERMEEIELSADEEFKKRAILFDTLQEMIGALTLTEGSGCLVVGDLENPDFVASVYRVADISNVPPDLFSDDIVNLDNGLIAYKTAEIQGGGGGSGGGYVATKMTMVNETGWSLKTLLVGSDCDLSFSWSSTEDDVPTGQGVVQVKVNGSVRYTGTVQQGLVELSIAEYLITGSNLVRVEITDLYGWKRVLSYNISVFAMEIKSSFSTESVFTDVINFSYIPVGEALKVVHFLIDNSLYATVELTVSNREQHIVLPKQTHGSHTLEVYFTAVIDGQQVQSNTLYYDMICTVPNVSTPIIASAFTKTDFSRYDRALITYRVFTPDLLNSTVDLYEDGVKTDTISVNRDEQTWSYKFINAGATQLKIVVGSVEKVFNFNVSELEIPVTAETSGLSLYLDASGRSNSREDREVWNYGNIAANLNNFTFVNDGWQLDDDGATCLRVSGDARVEIPFNIFTGDFRITGKTIEIEFTTRDVLNYDTAIFSTMNNGVGLHITAQRAFLNSEQVEVMTQYKEDEHVRLSFVIEKKTDYRLILCYINGVLSRSLQYPLQDNFAQNVPTGITIGSNDCTTDIYNIRVYDNNLSRDQLLDNWIADTQNFEKLVNRYRENDIFDAYGNIVIEKLPNYLPYMVLEAPILPQFKGDKKIVSGRYVDPRDPKRCFTFEGGQANVQGTSSAGYSRKNYKVSFKNGIILDGVPVDGFAIKDGDILADEFTFKADVASSEGANNTMLVKTYNDTVPYKTPPQVIDPRVRQGIDGFPIVMFHDNGTTTKFLGKYNFNNDKGNLDVFGFTDLDQSWEILNNTSNRTLFKSGDFSGEDWMNDFEARQPEDFTDITELSAMVQWVVSTDQEAATGAVLPIPVVYDGITHTLDSAAYRLAKFKNEAADWFEIDSLLYYYIFTELFLASDSRAKNAFPSKYHGGKWCFMPYDMDTGIGTNNEGSLVFDYHLEDIDTLAGADVFNGQKSALWINVRAAFYDDIKAMYQDLRSDGKLSYTNVSGAFTQHQSAWSQAIFNEDAYFKYLEPLFENNETIYLPMLQGDKAEQRKWWLYNRFRYLDSKYNAADSLTSFITLRGYSKDNITVTPYADIYASVKYGSYLTQTRALRGASYTLVCPLDNLNDTEIYIYSASQIKDLGDLSGLKVGLAEFAHASKLEKIKLGDATAGYTNPNLTDLSVGNNTLLRSIDVRNCVNLVKPVDFSGCKNLEDLYFQGTGVTALVLPDGGRVKNLHIPATIANLTLVNQHNLAVLDSPSFANVTTLRIENTNNVPYDRILSEATNLVRIRLINADMQFEDVSSLYRLLALKGLDQNNSNIETPVITGTCHVTKITEQVLRYFKGKLPELTITYDELEYDFTVSFVNWDNTVLDVQRLKLGEYAVNPVTREVDPILMPSKESDPGAHYYFENNWDIAYETIQETSIVKALYTTVNRYTATFIGWNGTALYVKEVLQGELITNPITDGAIATPIKPGDALYDMYAFKGWDKPLTYAVGNITFTAVFVGEVPIEMYELGTDSDFQWVVDYNYGYLLPSKGTVKGYYKYIGTKPYVIIPGSIGGETVISGIYMFKSNSVVKGVMMNPGNSLADASYMFQLLQSTTLDLSRFDTSSVTKMNFMFLGASPASLDLSNFNTSNVTTMQSMLSTSYLIYLDVSNFDTSKVTNMKNMFNTATKVTSLDLSSFDTSNVLDMNGMFGFCSVLSSLDISNFNTAKVTDMGSMFVGTNLPTLDLSHFNTSSVTVMSGMFQSTTSTTLNISSFDTTVVTNMSNMFYGSHVTTLDLSHFNTANVNNMTGMFNACRATSLNVSGFNTSKLLTSYQMFTNCRAATLDLRSFDTSKMDSMGYMFSNAFATKLYLSSFDTSKVTNMGNMFYNSSAEVLDLSSFNIIASTMSSFVTGAITKIVYVKSQATIDYILSKFPTIPTQTVLVVKTSLTDHYELSGAEINQILNDLPTITTAKTLDFSDCVGASTCDPSIGTAKGWTIITV